MELLDGKFLSGVIKEKIKSEVEAMVASGHTPPHLSAVLVGEDPASQTYVRSKMQSCEFTGFASSLVKMEASITEQELLSKIAELNADPAIDGFIVQLPLPAHISESKVIEAILPEKDVDGFHPVNIGRMSKNLPATLPATPRGILEIIKYYKIPTAGKHCVIVGRSNIVGMPMAILMGRKNDPGNCTVTLTHSRTKNMKEICRTADILVAAIGKAGFITADMVQEGAVVIDVGMNSIPDASRKSGYRLAGDVDFEKVSPKCSWITPVPRGVGPMTVTALLQNTLEIAKLNRGI